MSRAASLFCGVIAGIALSLAQAIAQPANNVGTEKIADGVYVFRWRSYQSLFIATPSGVLVTDPINERAAKDYMTEIRKVTAAPISYLVYSHHHYDHVMGGGVFKEAGATVIAHRNAKGPLDRLKNPLIVPPDRFVDVRHDIELGGKRIHLLYLGRNHTDNSLVLHLPDERIIFAVDFIAYKEVPWRGMFDSYIDEWIESLGRVLELDWDRVVVGHSRLGGIGTKEDVLAQMQYMIELKEVVRLQADKCIDSAMQEIKLPKYEAWTNYKQFLPRNVERLCHYWRFGYQ